MIRARVLKKQGEYGEAIKTLKSCLSLSNAHATGRNQKLKGELMTSDKVSVYVELCDAYIQNNEQQEAAAIMEKAMIEFHVNENTILKV